jgi:hypothetical protein
MSCRKKKFIIILADDLIPGDYPVEVLNNFISLSKTFQRIGATKKYKNNNRMKNNIC